MKPIDLDVIEKSVAEAEARTCAEFIVVINRQSGSYLDREVLHAVVWAFAMLLIVVYSPWSFDPALLPPNLLLLGVVVFGATRVVPPWRRAVIGRARQERQARLHARNAFHVLNVSGTRDRTGLLVYVTRLEDRVVLLPDFGVEARVEPAVWQGILDRAGSLSNHANPTLALCGLLEECARVLAERLPPKDANPDELPNRPRLEVV